MKAHKKALTKHFTDVGLDIDVLQMVVRICVVQS